MTSENRPNPRFDEDLHFERGDGPPDYGYRTDGPVRHFAVADETGTVLGYVWGNDEDDAAAWSHGRLPALAHSTVAFCRR
ncbi:MULTISPECIES: hypothetical protein [unclassified Streptomyces]|uniref:hypothetical protein n=1 Tax=unclassified Streptomyces TaxID=2593676 RepID=UPI002DD94CBA|nr:MULTISPECIES: hypothetical protein [unclassified Streptomyces]WSF85345.1 hypothetical protein OIE70_20895 [Streptomyces sp. NBC_01744]WSC38365.1 hypothetical protein OHA08_24280 [Streptomyces sp. NBC_01763]WSC46504.1 hypothetical protein OIE61_22550 [Streptomyces sp. NBC_01762]WSC54507.1 hypothetical protein OG808_20795 [Streptomyces sp. NBC_01761]WSD26156.1 hypothetical protein OHA26_23240 [Streptomyces sp. NBC_01751]